MTRGRASLNTDPKRSIWEQSKTEISMLLISMKREFLSLHCTERWVWFSYHWLTHFGIKSIRNIWSLNVLSAMLLKRFPHQDWLVKVWATGHCKKTHIVPFYSHSWNFLSHSNARLGCLTRWLRVEGITSRLLCKSGCSSSQLLGESSPRSLSTGCSLHHCCLPISKYWGVHTWYLSKKFPTTFSSANIVHRKNV